MDQARREAVARVLTEKGAVQNCPRCTNANFSVVGEGIIALQEEPRLISIGGPSIPVIIVACNRCGFISQHAQVPLGLMRVPAP